MILDQTNYFKENGTPSGRHLQTTIRISKNP